MHRVLGRKRDNVGSGMAKLGCQLGCIWNYPRMGWHTCEGFVLNLKWKELLLIQIFEIGRYTFNLDLLSFENSPRGPHLLLEAYMRTWKKVACSFPTVLVSLESPFLHWH